MSPPVLYSASISPPCRGVLLATGAADIEVQVEEIKLQRGEHRKKEFLKMNPQHTVPTLNDNGFFLVDSHAIVTYLIDKYAKDDSLYSKNLQQRAVINQRLHFNNASVLPNLKKNIVIEVVDLCDVEESISKEISLIIEGKTKIPQDRLNEIEESYGFLETFLEDNDWLAGNTYTLADTSIIASVSSMAVFAPLDKYQKLTAWLKRCEENIPGYATSNEPGLAILRSLVRARELANRS